MAGLVRRISRRRTNDYIQSQKSKRRRREISTAMPDDEWRGDHVETRPLATPTTLRQARSSMVVPPRPLGLDTTHRKRHYSEPSDTSLELSGGQYDTETEVLYTVCTPIRGTSSPSSSRMNFNLNKPACDISSVTDATYLSLRHRNSEVDCSTPLQSTLSYPQNSTLIDEPCNHDDHDVIQLKPQLSIRKKTMIKRSKFSTDIVCKLQFSQRSAAVTATDDPPSDGHRKYWWRTLKPQHPQSPKHHHQRNPARPHRHRHHHHYTVDSDSSLDTSIDVDDTIINADSDGGSDRDGFNFLASYKVNNECGKVKGRHPGSDNEDIIPEASMIAHRYSKIDMDSVKINKTYTSRKSLRSKRYYHMDETDYHRDQQEWLQQPIQRDVSPRRRPLRKADYSRNWVLESTRDEIDYVQRRYSTSSSKPSSYHSSHMKKTESVKQIKTLIFSTSDRKRYASSPMSNDKRGQKGHGSRIPRPIVKDTWYISPEEQNRGGHTLLVDSDCTSFAEKPLRPLPVTATKKGSQDLTRRKSIVKRLKSIGRQLRTGTRPKNNLKTLAII